MKKKILCLKVGGSVITDKKTPYTAHKDTIRKIAQALKGVKTQLVISHGSGSFGHTSAAKYIKKHGYTSRWGAAKVSHDARTINAIVTEIFIEVGLPAVSFSPMSFISAKKSQLDSIFIEPVLLALDQGLIPVVYGDVIWDKTQKSTIFSGETVLSHLSLALKDKFEIEGIVELCNVNGVLDTQGQVIPRINTKSWIRIKDMVGKAASTDVTGGMRHKVEEALSIARLGVSTTIINGTDPGYLRSFFQKKFVGTTISL